MNLLTQAIRTKLLKNGEVGKYGGEGSNIKPVLKLFTPWGSATWLITEMHPDDMLFGLCDLGAGCPELGYVSLRELESVGGPGGLKVERDRYFTADKTLDQYHDESLARGRIVA